MVDVIHNPHESRFEIQLDDNKTAVLAYRVNESTMVMTSTFVPPSHEGQGIGSALAQRALNYAREHQFTVLPECSFVRAYIKRHKEYQALTPS